MVLLGTIHLHCYAQYFSGELHYQLTVVPKSPGINADSLLDLEPGTSSLYLITDRYYKSTYFRDGKQTYSYTYHDETRRMYDEVAGKAYITWRDSRKGNTEFIGAVLHKDSVLTILGHTCFMGERIYEDYRSKTWYTPDLRINPESFRGHEVGDWYRQMKAVGGAMSLKTVTEYPTHVEIMEVVKIVERPVKREEFNLPAKVTVASFSALDKPVDLKPPAQTAIDCYNQKLEAASGSLPPQSYVCYVGFIVSETGAVSHVDPYEEDAYGVYKIAVDIINNCGFEFMPGEIAGEAVSSWVYFPIQFGK
jgi:hypothetical protein